MTYKKQSKGEVPTIISYVIFTLKFLVKKYSSVIDKNEQTYLLSMIHSFIIPLFYIIPKVHKDPISSRPILAGHRWILTPASTLVGHYLQQFEVHFPQILKDTKSLVIQMENLILPQNIIFITMDFESLYTNIPISEAMNAVKDLFYQFPIPQGDLLLALLIAILNLNLMEFNGEYYLQLEGLGMGTSLAVVLANIFVGTKEKDFRILLHQEILLYRRLIDDILVLWNGSMDSAIAFVDKVNNMGKTLKVTKKFHFMKWIFSIF